MKKETVEKLEKSFEEALRRLKASIGLSSTAAPFGRSVEPAGGLAGVSRRKQ